MKVERAIDRIINRQGWGREYKIMKLQSLGIRYGNGSAESEKWMRRFELQGY